MINEKDKELDDFFQKRLQDPVGPAYREDDWSALEQMLEKSRKPKVIYWLPYLSGAAAVLLLFLGWWAFRPKPTPQSQLQVAVTHQKPIGTATPAASTRQPATKNKNAPQLAEQSPVTKNSGNPNRVNTVPYSQGGTEASSRKNLVENNPGGQFVSLTQTKKNPNVERGTEREFAMLSAAAVRPVFENDLVNQPLLTSHDLRGGQGANLPDGGKSKPKIVSQAFRPQFALTVLAAPDLNSVSSFQQSKVGTNVGVQFSAGVSRKFTLTTGIIYSAKPYLTNFESYHTRYKFSVTPVNVTADCRMLDIPLNVGYQVYNRHQNRISVGTGLSSYLMLHENYTFNYATPPQSYYGYSSPTSYTVPHSKSYLMGVFNLNATYERPISSKIDIAVEPYLKLPLTNIGYSQVRLQSTGIAIGLKWNLNAPAKP